MRPKGLSQREIQRIVEFDWNESEDDDDGNGGEEEEENIIEENLENIKRMERIESETVSKMKEREAALQHCRQQLKKSHNHQIRYHQHLPKENT